MNSVAERYRNVASGMTERVRGVGADGWTAPSPCEAWTARDIVAHLVETGSRFLTRAGVSPQGVPAVEDDPVGAWDAIRSAVQGALDDPAVAQREYETEMGPSTFEQTVSIFGIGDVLVHTWDLARATHQDETLDSGEVHLVLSAMERMESMMRGGTAFGPRVEVSDDADEQTRLIAFTGRTP